MAALERIGRLLPGPATNIHIEVSTSVIPETGTGGYTDPNTRYVTIWFDPGRGVAALHKTLGVWLAVTLAHEVDHSVRVQGGPGFGPTLLDNLISEGLSSAFDIEVEPTITLPWTGALTAAREHALWERARPLLGATDLYDQWFFGGGGVPFDAGFTIGYHIVRDYLARHPHDTAASIVHLTASTILTGSDYAP
jgi:uncharacterized protein YjaZ